ncbi:hypothetical protein [Aureimonas jatrophae]|uniref:Uncharacterized protein n=1 Tax=Aureimonas jatrophae TaxID=1166073 RepID=A0A1H0IJY8_9HYPH|nr:hypothetical protein [Aureimonas jatrophae]MBB3952199.1 hypothetical protein [Aureimonas jatrophae]SDO31361.1 hypothetical protein SAMN05192530_105175 [Aureimonas jatrophae]
MTARPYPVTPDGRYFVARNRLWRCTDPTLADAEREAAVYDLMRARRQVRDAADDAERRDARRLVDAAKRRLGERGPVWWSDGAPDLNRHAPHNTPYAAWFAGLPAEERGRAGA